MPLSDTDFFNALLLTVLSVGAIVFLYRKNKKLGLIAAALLVFILIFGAQLFL